MAEPDLDRRWRAKWLAALGGTLTTVCAGLLFGLTAAVFWSGLLMLVMARRLAE